MTIDERLLEILVCPACRATVRPDEAGRELVCQGCRLAYPVREDVPVMLVDQARRPDDDGSTTPVSPGDPAAPGTPETPAESD